MKTFFNLFKCTCFIFSMLLLSSELCNAQTDISWVDENVAHSIDSNLNYGYSTSVTTNNGDIYYTYVGSDQKIYVGKKRNGIDNVYAVMTSLQSDDFHTKPSIAIDKNGYIHLTGDAHNQDWKYYISNEPYNIYSWTRKYPPGKNVTYMEFYKDRNDELYTLFRMKLGDASEDHVGTMMRYNANNGSFTLLGTDNYNSDGAPVKAIVFGLDGGGFGCAYQQPRPRVFFDKNNRMHLTASVIDPCYTSGNSGYNRQTHVIYAYSDDGGNTFKKPGGANISLPLTVDNASVVVARSSQQDILPESHVGALNTNTPVVSYRTKDGTSYGKRWNGSSWVNLSLPDNSSSLFLTNTKGVIAWYHKYSTGNARFNLTNDGVNWTSVNSPGGGTSNRSVEAIDQQYFEETGDVRIHFAYTPSGGGKNCNVHTFDTSAQVNTLSSNNGGGNDAILSVSAPTSVNPGSTVSVTVEYEASTNRDVVVVFQKDSPDFDNYGEARASVSAGSGSVTIDVPISTNTPIANDAYQFQTFITTTGSGWPGLDNIARKDVDAVSGGGTPPSNTNVVVRARMMSGTSDQLQLQNNGVIEKTWTITGSNFADYSYDLNNVGEIRLYFPDNGTDLEIDWIEIEGTRYQAEDQQINTSAYENGSCGGDFSQLMHCEGYIDFGTLGTNPGNNTNGDIVIRAKGSCGTEIMELRVDNTMVLSETVTTNYTNYTYSGYAGGTITIHFLNDGNSGCDKNLYIDYITVCGNQIESESAGVTQSSDWTNGDKQILFTNGSNNYNDPGCASNSRQQTPITTKENNSKAFNVFPNPLKAGQLKIKANGTSNMDSEIVITNLQGVVVYNKKIKAAMLVQVDASIFQKNGMYLIIEKVKDEVFKTHKLIVNRR